jgi:hypothetical protein
MRFKTIGITVISLLIILSAINVVQADPTSGNIKTYLDITHTTESHLFIVGQNIYIQWILTPVEPTTHIIIYNQNNQPIFDQMCPGDSLTWSTSTPGTYYIVVPGGFIPIAVASVSVVPESAFGSVMAIGAGLAAFGTIGTVKFRHTKTKKE